MGPLGDLVYVHSWERERERTTTSSELARVFFNKITRTDLILPFLAANQLELPIQNFALYLGCTITTHGGADGEVLPLLKG